MKKILLLLLVVTSIQFSATAQSPVIKEFRALLQSAKTNFKDDIGEKIEEDTANNLAYYKTKKADFSVISSFIIHQLTNDGNTYVINYNVKDADANTLVLIMHIVDLYIDELNAMIKTGNYTGRDYNTDDGMSVSEIKDLNGNHILNYKSNKEVQRIVIYSIK